jgi:hypothetical protein
VRCLADVETDVVAGCLDPVDFVDRDRDDAAVGAREEAAQVLLLRAGPRRADEALETLGE